MQSLTEQVFRRAPPGGVFDRTVVCNLFPDLSEGARRLLIHRAMCKGEVWRLRPGLYILAPEFRKCELHPFSIAGLLFPASHISLQSALSHHALIPEAVYQISSVTAARGRAFKNAMGAFSFQRVPANDPRSGVDAVKLDAVSWAFVAGPLRTIADLVYVTKDVRWERDGSAFLTDSMRIERDDLDRVSFESFQSVFESIRSHRTRGFLTGLKKELEK